jgi:hypothetical protein
MAYLFPWSDAVYYPTTLGVRTSIGRFALEPAWVDRAVVLLVRLARRWLSNTGFVGGNRRVVDRLNARYAGRDHFAITVTGTRRGRSARMTLVSRNQADVTAAAAAELVQALVRGEVDAAGVWLPEQVIDPDRFFGALGALGWGVSLADDAR